MCVSLSSPLLVIELPVTFEQNLALRPLRYFCVQSPPFPFLRVLGLPTSIVEISLECISDLASQFS